MMQFLELELLLPLEVWRRDPAGACRQALAPHGDPLRWAVTAAHGRPDGQQWLRLEAVLLIP